MQPRQLGLVFCSENNNAKQALPDQKDSRKLEISVLVYGKRRLLWSRIKKWAENEQGVFMHTYTDTHFLLFAGQNCLQTWSFCFCPAETGDCHVVQRQCAGGKRLSSCKYRLGTTAQELLHRTALNMSAIVPKMSTTKGTTKVLHQTGEVWTGVSSKLRDKEICGHHLKDIHIPHSLKASANHSIF